MNRFCFVAVVLAAVLESLAPLAAAESAKSKMVPNDTSRGDGMIAEYFHTETPLLHCKVRIICQSLFGLDVVLPGRDPLEQVTSLGEPGILESHVGTAGRRGGACYFSRGDLF